MALRKQQLQSILDSLPPEEWEKPYIFSYDEESRIVHTLVATKPGTNELYYLRSGRGQMGAVESPIADDGKPSDMETRLKR